MAAAAAVGAAAAVSRAAIRVAAGIKGPFLLFVQCDEVWADVLLGLPSVGVAIPPPARRCGA